MNSILGGVGARTLKDIPPKVGSLVHGTVSRFLLEYQRKLEWEKRIKSSLRYRWAMFAGLEKLWEAKIFTNVNPQSTYNLVHVCNVDKWKITFSIMSGHFDYCVMSNCHNKGVTAFSGLCQLLRMTHLELQHYNMPINHLIKKGSQPAKQWTSQQINHTRCSKKPWPQHRYYDTITHANHSLRR